MLLELRFPDRREEERFSDFLVSRRLEARWWDVTRTLIAISALFKHMSEAARGTGPWTIAAIYCFSAPANFFDSLIAQNEIGSWKYVRVASRCLVCLSIVHFCRACAIYISPYVATHSYRERREIRKRSSLSLPPLSPLSLSCVPSCGISLAVFLHT